jgi:threonine dehydrogenase-like Zn-dependent dehydrogenase
MTMRALQFYDKEDIRLVDVAIPEVGSDQVRIRPAFVGICGTGRTQDLYEIAFGFG